MPVFPIGKRICARAVCPPAFMAACMLACALPVRATGAETPHAFTDTLEFPDTEIRGNRATAPATGVYRLDSEALQRFATLEEALEALPGFRVRRQGGLGGYSEVRFRGAGAAQVAVYVDGIRLNQDGDAAPDLSKWPLLWFSSLEARTGFDPSGTGPGVLARIDLSTLPEGRVSVQSRAGSFSALEAAVSTQAGDAWKWSIGAQGQSARNNFPFFSDNGTLYNPEDDGVWRMDNNAYWSQGARASVRREKPESRQVVSLLWLESRKEYPGLFPSVARAYTRRNDWLAAWRLENDGARVPWEIGAQARRFEDSYRDPAQSLGYLSYESARHSNAIEADARARFRLGEIASARLDLRARGEETVPLVTPYSARYSSPRSLRNEAQAGVAVDARLSPYWIATVEMRRAFIRFRARGLKAANDTVPARLVSTDRLPLAARAALQWTSAVQSLGLHARLEQRAPSSGELLGDNLGIKTKLDLRPEETRSVSLVHSVTSKDATLPVWRVQSSLFWNDYNDPIRLKAHGASAFMRYENDADYRSIGFETLASLTARLSEASLSVTLQEAAITKGLYQGNQPAHQSPLESHAELFVKPPSETISLRAGILADFRAAYHPGGANIPDARRDAEWEFGAHAGVERGPVRIALDARNLTDRHYRDFAYSPRSGRNYSAAVFINL